MRFGPIVAGFGLCALTACMALNPDGTGWTTQTSCPANGATNALFSASPTLSSGRATILAKGKNVQTGRYSDSRGRDGDFRAQIAGVGMSMVVEWDDGGTLTTTYARDETTDIFTGLDSEGCIVALRAW